jgi:hypothetical protein
MKLPNRRLFTPLLVACSVGTALLGFSCSESGTHVGGPGPVSDAGAALPPLESSPPPIVPVKKRLDATSSPVIFDPMRGGVWTANGDVGSVSYVDVDARRVVFETAVGKDIRSVALSPDARWIAAVDRDGASVALLDAETGALRRTIPVGTHPRAAVWDTANPRWLYVAIEDDGAIAMIDRVAGALFMTIPVGRLPSGVAVSKSRREVYVTHRIDAKVTIVDLAQRRVSADVALADQPADPDPKKPQGKPFAFESLAWTADGNTAWLPHEILAPTHPFQFQTTLFPAISVVDLSDAQAEVQTDPLDPNGAIAGRKVLFDAINVLDETGTPEVLSQPCAAALHPKGLVGYALACASEDLIVFELGTGIATDVLRNLPGDHPVGLTLDDTGQRAWILSDQSKTLQMVTLGDGTPVKRVKLAGDPLALVATDSVAAELREGLKLFHRANSSKGPLAITGNNWMACAGCHLDGFVSTNAFFFEALVPLDRAKDARIGHASLKDLFSKSPMPNDPAFDPHDVLSAVLEQGGLAPDRTGAHRQGELDPSAPTPEATQMAKRLALIIARDLPEGPSWLLKPGDAPNAAYDGAWCGNCHKTEFDAWKVGVHSHAGEDPMVRFCAGVEKGIMGPQYPRLCAGCHDPVGARTGDSSLATGRGVTCLGCHDTSRLINAGGNADLEQQAHDWTKDHKDWGIKSLERLRKPEFCGGCHQQFAPATGITAINTLGEFQRGPFAAGGTSCVDCHMPKDAKGVADHRIVGGNVYMGMKFGDATLVADQKTKLRSVITLRATRAGGGVFVAIKNRGAGHSFPTGVSDVREPWIEIQAVDAQGNVIARYGGADASGAIPFTANRLGMDIAKEDGTILLLHELSKTTRVPFELRVAPGATETMLVGAPTALPAGAARFEAVLYYRNVRTAFFRAAVGDVNAVPPQTELARTVVE